MTALDLRPLSLGEILDRTFLLYRRHFLLFIGIAAVPHLLTLALALLEVWFVHLPPAIDPSGIPNLSVLGLTFFYGLIFVLFGLVVYIWSQAGTIAAVTQLYLGRSTSIAQSLGQVWENFGSLLGVTLLNLLALIGATLLLFFPGIYVACRLIVCLPAAVVERRGPSDSLSRSWSLTRGDAGRAFVLFLLYLVISVGLSLLITAPLTLVIAAAKDQPATQHLWQTVQQVLSVGMNAVVSPFILIGTSVFYFDLRVRKEAFDLQLMMDPTSERITHTTGQGPTSPSLP